MLRVLTRRAAHFALFASLTACGGAPQQAQTPQHVLLIVIDTLRADHLGVYGYQRATSPVIDQLAREGVRFERAISQASFTSPSMVSLMTGHYIAKERLDIPADLATLAESFHKAGWATAAFVTNDLITPKFGFARGFDRFEVIEDYGSNTKITQWLEESKQRKTFTYIHIKEPHDPYNLPSGPGEFRAKKDLLPGDRAQFYEQITSDMQLEGSRELTEHIKEEIGGYDDDVRYADGRVGEFLKALDQAGLRATTAIAITADHGEGLWEHIALMNGQRATKLSNGEPPSLTNALMPTHGNQVHQELVHVPMLLVGTGVERGVVVREPVENLDLFPTLLELGQVPSPGGLQGTSLLRHLDGSKVAKDTSFSFTRFNSTVITADGMQLILPTDEGVVAEDLQPELYDLKSDPYQRRNLAREKPELVKQLSAIAEQRLRIAIHEHSAADPDPLVGLGYNAQAARQSLQNKLEGFSPEELMADLTTFNTPAVERLLCVEQLASRALDDAARQKLRGWRAKETSPVIRRKLDELLAR